MSSMIGWAATSKNRRFKCFRRPLEVIGGLYTFHIWWAGASIIPKHLISAKKLQDITFLELSHDSYIKLTEVVGVSILGKI